MKNNRFFVFLTAMFVFLTAFVFITLVKNFDSAIASKTQNRAELIARVKNLEKERNSLKEEIFKLRKDLEKVETQAAEENARIKEIKQELDVLRKLSGMTPVSGRGIEIVLTDGVPTGNLSPEDVLVHDSDLRVIVNALSSARPEAISINGERVTFVTSIRCVGPSILVNNRRVSSPIQIRAIGNPEELEDALRNDPRASYYLYDLFPHVGIGVKISRKSSIEIGPFSGNFSIDLSKVRVIE